VGINGGWLAACRYVEDGSGHSIAVKNQAIFLGQVFVGLSGARVAYLAIAYWMSGASTPRFKVESACVAFVVLGMTLRFVRGGIRESDGSFLSRLSARWMWPAFCGLALALYWPALSLGYLSDDFVLIERASQWNFSQFNAGAYRPIPLLLWAVIGRVGGSAAVHLFNILLHGTNGYLTTRLFGPWVRHRGWAVLAGSLFLVSSAGSEAVAWCSGVFDVLATTLVLTCALLGRQYRNARSPAVRVLFFLVAIGALGSKETAAVAGILVLIDAWICGTVSRSVVVDSSALIVASAAYGMIRRWTFPNAVTPDPKFMIQRGLFGAFEAVAAPWHVDVVRETAWIPVVGTAVTIGLLLVFFLRRPDTCRTIMVIAAALWVVIPIVPVLPFFVVGPDLQGARFVYLATVGWAGLVVAVARPERPAIRPEATIGIGLVLVAVTVMTAATRLHLVPWIHAAELRDRVQTAARRDPRLRGCDPVYVQGMPDNVSGAYVFRNGVETAFIANVGVRAVVGGGPPGCTFRWTGVGFAKANP
jgi:hypothetical protein